MVTLEELAQLVNTLQGQQHASNQEISKLTSQNQQFRHGGSPGLVETATEVGQAVQTAISNANPRSSQRQSFGGIKGLGKPPTFRGESARFTKFPASGREALDQQFGPLGAEPVGDVQDKSELIHVALLALTESGSFDIVLGAAPPGLEALRRLVRRWILSVEESAEPFCEKSWFQIGVNCKIWPQDSSSRRNWFADTKRANRAEQRQHLAMNRARLITYWQVRSEIQDFIAARRSQFAFKIVAAKELWTALVSSSSVRACGFERRFIFVENKCRACA